MVYLDGVPLDPTASYVNRSVPGRQVMTLLAAPAPGVMVTVDMSFYYATRFPDESQDFEAFMDQLWALKKLTLQSVIG